MNQYNHETVFKKLLIELLELQPGCLVFDCTAGRGGHTQEILTKVGSKGSVFALDCDSSAIAHLSKKFEKEIKNKSLHIIHSRFSEIDKIAKEFDLAGKIDAICADLGVSSPQLEESERGFSFQSNGPLDMRMDQKNSTALTASDVVNTYSYDDLFTIIKNYGEEPKARFIAKNIVKERERAPIRTTHDLAEIVAKSVHYSTKSKKHPATKTFMALRIAVNDELRQIEKLIDNGFSLLKLSGRLGIISFHSLEDRIVKKSFQNLTGKFEKEKLQKGLPLREDEIQKRINQQAMIIKPFPGKPTEHDIQKNPRARSAKLRVLEKISSS